MRRGEAGEKNSTGIKAEELFFNQKRDTGSEMRARKI